MYRNKKDVDKHVDSLMYKLLPKDFKLRAYSIARLYFEVGDYVSCQKYVEQYLSLKSNSAAAHKLLGEAYSKLGEKEKALEHYKTCLDIDPTQTSTILNVCELLADDDVSVDTGRAKYWCEKTEAMFPKHPVTFRLREKLLAVSNPDPDALASLLKTELDTRPKDVILHVRLIKHLLQTNNIKEAFDHACNIEFDEKLFSNNFTWYESLSEILKYYTLKTSDWLYNLLLLTVNERMCVLSLMEVSSCTAKSLVESMHLLHSYDQAIEIVAKAEFSPGCGEFHNSLLQHHRGQLAFHAALYLLKKAKKGQFSWREAKEYSAPLLVIAWHTAPLDLKVNWLKHAHEKQQNAVRRWYLEGSYRCSQSGHVLLSNMQDKSQVFVDQISQLCSGPHWKDKLYGKIFSSPELVTKLKSSYLASNSFNITSLRLPRTSEVKAYDDDAQREHPSSLHHFVWILLNYKNYAEFKCTLFDMLTPTAMINCGPETLNKIDVLAFLFSATLTTQQFKDNKTNVDPEIPILLPANITDFLCSLPQTKWWDCAYKLSQNEWGNEYTDIRSTLSRGIEIIRCIDNHGLDPELLCLLGRIFIERSKLTNLPEDKINLEIRARLYYISAIPILENYKTNMLMLSEKRMFNYTNKLNTKEINLLLEECKLQVASSHLNDGEYEKVINLLSHLKSPQAYYYLSDTYKKIALEERNTTKNHDNDTKYVNLLGKAKHFAYKALDRIKDLEEPKNKTLQADIQLLIEELESFLNKIDLEFSQNVVNDNYSSDEYNSVSEIRKMYSKSNQFQNASSTPKQTSRLNLNVNATNYRTAVDSQTFERTHEDQLYLERIEKQIMNLQKRETTINDFMEQTKDWFEENRKLSNQIISTINCNIQNTTDQFKLLKISVDQVKEQIDECRNESKDVADLKKQLTELKKEVNKLKTNKTITNQTIDESDIYNLEDEYRTHDNTSGFGAQLPFTASQVVPPFTQRFMPPFSVPSNPYQLYGQNFYNLYNQYSQFAQPSTIPGAPPIFDPTRTQMNYPGVYPTPDQMYLDVAHLVPPTLPTGPAIPTIPTTIIPVVSTVSSTIVAPKATLVPTSKVMLDSKEIPKSLPVNVVITSSDPLPASTTEPSPVLSVTIPRKHIKGSPHNYQIPMPSSNDPKVIAPPVFSFPSLSNKSNVSTSSNILNWNSKSQFVTSQAENTLSTLNVNKPLEDSDNSKKIVDGMFPISSANTSLNKSRTLSEKSNTSIENYDPCPDFKPIVPLPAEVKITTGEEDEEVIFTSRAKLYRFVDKQWKERGIGEMKLLKHIISGKVRVLMRRDQVHKICANHIIIPEMEIKLMKNETKAYCWVAHDFAEETFILEKFCVRFKTADIAKEFYETFEKARKESISSNKPVTDFKNSSNILKPVSEITTSQAISIVNTTHVQSEKTVIGGFTFTSKPTFKIPLENSEYLPKNTESSKSKKNVFSGLTFSAGNSPSFNNTLNFASNINNKPVKTPDKINVALTQLNTSDTVEDFEPSTDFKPVVPLPALIDQKTGEEDETVLFEHRAKLLRFESTSKEWKERGLGNIKLLVHKENNQKLRLLMRREQIMKVCCNHSITKEMLFQKMINMDKAVTWCAKDFSEGALVSETFCLRFKTTQLCDDFIEAVKAAQEKIKDDIKPAIEQRNDAKQYSQSGFGDKFKPKPGSWFCDSCYTNNIETFMKCACCETINPQSNVDTSTNALTWGDKFRPKPGSWECKECLIRNEAENENCNACNNPKDGIVKKAEVKVYNIPNFRFGIPSTTVESSTQSNKSIVINSWGDKFKPKEGTWECKYCFVRNESTFGNCSACNNPNDVTASTIKGTKLSFGIPQNPTGSQIFNTNNVQKFTFGIPKVETVNLEDTQKLMPNVLSASKKNSEAENPFNVSVKEIETKDDTVTPVKTSLLQTPKTNITSFGKGSETFEFSFKPKPSAKGKSPVKSPKENKGDDSDGNEYVSEDEGHHIHFSPVIPMPDKIEVVTGEEHEEELYSHRAKLYIFNKEWKERGIGNVKLLKHKETGNLRVLMRREQVHKICLNHALLPDIIYKPKDDKTWLFVVNDFSEGEVTLQQFCLRFKNKEIAMQFKNAIDKAIECKINKNINQSSKNNVDFEDVIFISEIHASDEEKNRAKELMLPEHFYTYRKKEPCQGCRGCDDNEDNTKPESDKETSKSFNLLKQDFSIATPIKSSVLRFNSPSISEYGTPSNVERSINTSIFRTPLSAVESNITQTVSPQTSTFVMTDSDATDKENTLTDSTNAHVSLEHVTFISAGQMQNQPMQSAPKNPILALPKLTTLNSSTENKVSPSILGLPETKSNVDEHKTSFLGNKNNSNSKETSNKSVFGFNLQTTDSQSKSIFSDTNFAQVNFFNNTSQGSLFGPAALKSAQSKPPIFGIPSFTFGNSDNQNQDKLELVGTASTEEKSATKEIQPEHNLQQNKGIEKNSPDTKSCETQAVDENRYNSKVQPTLKHNESVIKEPLLKVDSSLTFEALSSSGTGFNINKKDDFQWEGAGQQLFVHTPKDSDDTLKKDAVNADDSGKTALVEEEYDPHYEPIVPLPEKIVVTTGEEDEKKLFGERSKLFRFDEQSRDWKERGIGEMKILYHPQRNTYRCLLRREQVHKAVLNMLLFMDMELLPMKNSDRAWTFAGHNYAEGAGGRETLAVRFKTIDLAKSFYDKIMECVRKLQASAAETIRKEKGEQEEKIECVAPLRLPKHLGEDARVEDNSPTVIWQTKSGAQKSDTEESKEIEKKINPDGATSSETNDVKQVHFEEEEEHAEYDEEDYEHDYEHADDYEYYYGKDEDEASVFYPCKAVVRESGSEETYEQTHVQVSFDHEICSPKILVTDYNTGEVVADMLIHTDTEFRMSGDTCSWSGMDYTSNVSVEKAVNITFTDNEAAMVFYDSCETSKAATYASTDPES